MDLTFGEPVKPCGDCMDGRCTMNCSTPMKPGTLFPSTGEVTALGKEYLERRVASMREVIDKQEYRHEDGDASRKEYWVGRLHEAKIALANLSQPLERRRDGFGAAADQ